MKLFGRAVRHEHVIIGVILILAAFLRFYRYDFRWGLAYDQARDAIIARQVLSGKQMPILGPFSSAGNFTTGPVWYWFVTLSTALIPFSVTAPWIIMTISYLALVFVFIRIGILLDGFTLGVILGILSAVSPAQIDQGLLLSNPSLVAICSVAAVWQGIVYLKTGKILSLYTCAFALGAAITAHYQSVLLIIFALYVIALRRPNIKHILGCITIGLIPFLPLFYFDFTHNHYNYKGVTDYILHGQYNVYIPNRWLTYAGIFVPHIWGYIIGGNDTLGYVLIFSVIAAVIFAYRNHTLHATILSLLIPLFVMIFALRFYRGQRYESYFVFLHPFILIISSWCCFQIFQKWKIAGIILVLLSTITSILNVTNQISHSENYTQVEVKGWINILTHKYPNEQFDMYDLNYKGTGKSLPLVLFMNQKKLLSPNGRKIGFGEPLRPDRPHHLEIKENTVGYALWDLSSSKSAELEKFGWARINPDDIYRGVTRWYDSKQ